MAARASRNPVAGLRPVVGHAETRRLLAQAATEGRIPNSILLHGPAGTGKQRLALWLGQLLLCAKPGPDAPCNACTPCRLALRLEHPDLHWFFPLPRPKAAGPEKLADALEEARAAELARRREQPIQPTLADGISGIYLAHVHVLVRSAYARPAMGRRKIFVVGNAEALVPQEASPEAANALLKVLEEPPSDTTLILTAADPDVLLPTIRSRLLPVRVRPLPEQEVVQFLVAETGATPDQARRVAKLAPGSIGRALAYLPAGKEAGPLEEIRQQSRALLEAALQPGPADRFTTALAISPAGARGTFSDVLENLTLWLRDLAATATGADAVVVNADAIDWLHDQARRHPGAVAALPAAIRDVEATLQLAQFNINPQLALAGLLRTLAARLHGR